ncbi:MAG: hypothetical protein KDC98_06930 [Planctomycetes bacterium]|nr:hypothetical protein [Planctomycetota bacterium]
MAIRLRHATAPMLLVALSSCCSLSRFFCGPDQSRWVSVTYDTPTDTVATLLEAIRRDDPSIVYQCMATGWKRRHHLGSLEAGVGWQRLRDEVPGIHMVGYAEIPEVERMGDNGARFVIETAGPTLRIDLVRESFRQVTYRRPNGTRGVSRVPLASWNPVARVEWLDDPVADKSRLVLDPLEFEHTGLDDVPLEAIEQAGLIRLWQIDDLVVIDS